MININNHRLKQLAFDRCHSIDLTFDCHQSLYQSLMKQFYSNVMPHISNNIQSLTISLTQIASINRFLEKNSIETFANLRHLKIVLGAKNCKTGIPFTIGKLIID